ncbi:unnamed protein product [Dovyalis caffra]|uniref:Uncharacterized protein n=1 Tax=Dovyalis caffra TaxID=77055 RepID=A0AAV1QS75_9ROSI|nr:unnamed protein product [Dovyalis caffra]
MHKKQSQSRGAQLHISTVCINDLAGDQTKAEVQSAHGASNRESSFPRLQQDPSNRIKLLRRACCREKLNVHFP